MTLFFHSIILQLPLFNIIAANPWSEAEYSPIVGNLSCNQRINGSTTSNNFEVYWSFYLSNSVHAVEINTCASSYNTKMYLWYYESIDNLTAEWSRYSGCDGCGVAKCYPNEIWAWNLEDSLPAGYYFLSILGYQDNVGNYSVYLQCDEIQHIYVSKNGNNNDFCGDSKYNPCGTMYYASTKIKNDYIEIYVIDGQNESEIQNESDCLPQIDMEYIYYVYFDDTNIETMNDWYPIKCNNNQTRSYLFENTQDLRFHNLIIDDHVFMNQGIIWTESHMECYNCTFRNISFVSYDVMDIIYVGEEAFVEDSIFDGIYIVDASNFMHFAYKITFEHNMVMNINMVSNFITSKVRLFCAVCFGGTLLL